MKKDYVAGKGWEMDSSFTWHKESCIQCQRYSHDDPSSLALLCLEGSILLKDGIPKVRQERAPKPENWVSKVEAKRRMVYK